MSAEDFDDLVEQIVIKNPRYDTQAYSFVISAMVHTQRMVAESQDASPRHVTGAELLEGVRDYATVNLGTAAKSTLAEWGIHSCQDIGEIVFILVEFGLLGKSEHDSRADFKNGYDFSKVFPKPFYCNFWLRVSCGFAALLLLIVLLFSH